MPLNIRDPRAAELARKLVDRRGGTMTSVIIDALESELERDAPPLRERLARLSAKARGLAGPNPRAVTREEIDDIWRR